MDYQYIQFLDDSYQISFDQFKFYFRKKIYENILIMIGESKEFKRINRIKFGSFLIKLCYRLLICMTSNRFFIYKEQGKVFDTDEFNADMKELNEYDKIQERMRKVSEIYYEQCLFD